MKTLLFLLAIEAAVMALAYAVTPVSIDPSADLRNDGALKLPALVDGTDEAARSMDHVRGALPVSTAGDHLGGSR